MERVLKSSGDMFFAKFPIHAIYHREHEIKSNGDSKDGGWMGGIEIVARLFFDGRVVNLRKAC